MLAVTPMRRRSCVVAAIAGLLLLPALAFAKDKPKSTLSNYVLQARTVVVVIDPNAGVSLDDPQANQLAQRDVETALLNWGRFQPILAGQNADLVIVVRRGTGKLAAGTVNDPRQGRRPVAVDPTNNGISVGMQRGQPPPYAGDVPDASQSGQTEEQNMPGRPISDQPHPQAEIGNASSEDSFLVYRGKVDDPLDSSPMWRYEAKDALKPHKVPAVDVFRKAVNESEQAVAKQP
jgi:hypothetical protein